MRKMMIKSSSLHPLLLLLLLQLTQLLLILSYFPQLTRAQTYQNISSDTTLTTSGTITSVLSPSGDFAFGFTPLPSNGNTTTDLFLLAIWLAKTADKAIVWTANGNSPAPAGSTLSLSSNGQLLLTGPDGDTIFSSSASGGSHAAMLDTGNLVLVDANSSDLIWQSFNFPTDTILPTQVLSLINAFINTQLQSKLTSTNYSSGRFIFSLKGGDVSLRQLASPINANQSYNSYWSTSTSGSGSKLIFDPLGIVYLELINNTRINITSAGVGSNTAADFYQRATLDFDGVFRHYVYHKGSNGSWAQGWTSQGHVPDDICRAITNDVGSGACGFNSYCQLDGDQRAVCQCPSKYSFIDSSNEYRGCMPDFVAQRCDVDDSARFQLVEMVNTDWPLSDYEHYTPIVEDQCRDYCLSDCFCAVAIFRNGECWKKKLPLSNGKIGGYVGGKALIKVTKDNASSYEPGTITTIVVKKNDRKGLIIAGSSLLGGSVFINILFVVAILFMIFCYPCKRKHPHHQDVSNVSEHGLRCFTYEELREATNGFSEELGSGAFSTVYKGAFLNGKDSICIAVKKLNKVCQDVNKEFLAEVRSIGQTHHKNLVRLLGYCNEEENRLLVYQFMSNGSLTSFLFGEMKLEWNRRVKIILGVARGLLYLHEECITPIIHCDIKSQNILLDDNLVAKISDFGMAKLLGANQTRTNTGIRGTRGFVAPEWFKSMPITVKVDVYSFGVMLLETICCRKHLEESENEEAVVLVYWAYDCYREGRLDILVGSEREALLDMRRVERFVMVAIWCIQEDPSLRPTMPKVVLMLEGSVSVPVPPDPSSYMSSIQEERFLPS
ncbi:LOW QUALITY PROTEIN: G-type lectin S-receptor-like serine/threonine-protein kinase LECRK3 [Dioscorea cayenensis subsp. rotundata]|uniref:Receptor-like serine/threonine-protein kinase n=1 Tax=Dioscorea cayennensis subsp. rotundata TaxID=55577 RepID=A0AB40BE57_DIOCR|nr:LOW QUALITY PROTEIN: G-type lectin S-receptor-like serine/threonine-protein kinase LECRK3 [Dioscorea cayenensis subsp. rotundata]